MAGLTTIRVEEAAADGIELVDANDGRSLLTNEFVGQQAISFENELKSANSELYDCALEAAGITALTNLVKGGIKRMSKTAAKAVLKKVAGRALPAAGVIIASYEFGECMGWWSI